MRRQRKRANREGKKRSENAETSRDFGEVTMKKNILKGHDGKYLEEIFSQLKTEIISMSMFQVIRIWNRVRP